MEGGAEKKSDIGKMGDLEREKEGAAAISQTAQWERRGGTVKVI